MAYEQYHGYWRVVGGSVEIGGQHLDANFTAVADHTNADSGVHGVTGAVVGTTDSQTLTGKTISGSDNTLTNLPAPALASVLAAGSDGGGVNITNIGLIDAIYFQGSAQYLTDLRLGEANGATVGPGLAVVSGQLRAGGTVDIEITDSSKGFILKSPGGTSYRIVVSDVGVLTAVSV